MCHLSRVVERHLGAVHVHWAFPEGNKTGDARVHRRQRVTPIDGSDSGLRKLGCAQSAKPKSTAVQYSNAIDFDRASSPSNAQIRAQRRLTTAMPPSSQLQGGQGSVSCDNSCDNSWQTGGIHGHSWAVNGTERGPQERQNRRPEGV